MYRIAIDIGGTFTDCVVLDLLGNTTVVKSQTSPDDPSRGVLQAVEQAGRQLGLSVENLLQSTDSFVHGCTIATNAMIQRSGCKTGVITTRGHEDTLLIGRVFQKVAGLSERQITHISQLHKAEPPLVPYELIRGVSERIDCRGDVVLPLNMREMAEAVASLVGQGVESIGICLLWSFLNPAHEQAIKGYILRSYPDVFVTSSHELVPLLGEYERSVTTAINCYVGPKMAQYLDRLQGQLNQLGYRHPLLIMQAGGGLTSVEETKEKAVLTLDSGPVGGVLGSRFFGALYDEPNVICTDVGGTSFDVSVIHRGELQLEKQPVIDQYVFKIPKVLIKSIGAGGGSIAWVDSYGLLHVGPQSAGSVPGPACYGRGGVEPTVTDANLLLGYLSPDAFLGGRMTLDRGEAEAALGRLADKMNLDPVQVASGIFSITNAQMADLVRKCTIERGYDPRDFVLFAYGGAGPTHAALYSTDVGAKAVYVLLHSTAFSAFGMLTSDVIHTAQTSRSLRTPLGAADFETLNAIFAELRERITQQYREEGVRAEEIIFRRSISMRYQMQVHELAIDVPDGILSLADWSALETAFEQKYTGIYGPGTAVREAGVELVTCRLDGTHCVPTPEIGRQREKVDPDASVALKGMRPAYHEQMGGFAPTPIYDGGRLRWGHVLEGPSIVERMGDAVLIPPAFSGAVDQYGNIRVGKNGHDKIQY